MDGGMTAKACASGMVARSLPVQPVHDSPGHQARLAAIVPRIQAHEVERVVAGGHPGEQAEADDGVEVADALGLERADHRSFESPRSVRSSDAAGGS